VSTEVAIRNVLDRIYAAWRKKEFEGLEKCFHEQARIVGPDYVEYAVGRSKCAESYREFATNASVLDYSEDGHQLHIWDTVAVYTFRWRMTYQRENGAKSEQGTDQLVLQQGSDGWQVTFRYIYFQPSVGAT
jgi:hypothetical protein